MENMIEIKNLCKEYRGEGETVHVLENLDMIVKDGTISSVEGASGVGKSTLLNIIGTIDSATSGQLHIGGQEVSSMSSSSQESMRAHMIGFIFQHHYLLPDFTVLENVMMPMMIQRRPTSYCREEAMKALTQVGLEHRFQHYPSQISGGEMARSGVARALVGGHKLILADEPTGNLDKNNSDRLADLIWQLQSELKFTLLIVTHDRDLAERVPFRYRLVAGKLQPFS